MRAIILAGGKGSRLNPVISSVPKPMAPICGKPFLEILLDYWIQQGIDDFVLSVSHMAEAIQWHFGDNYRGCSIHYVREPEPLGTGGAVLYAMSQLEDLENPILVANGDSYAHINVSEMLESHQRQHAEITIACLELPENNRYSGIVLGVNNRITCFQDRKQGMGGLLVNAGIYLINPEVLLRQKWVEGDVFSIEDDFFPYMVNKKWAVYGYPFNSRFIDIGIPSDYQKAQSFFKNLGQTIN